MPSKPLTKQQFSKLDTDGYKQFIINALDGCYDIVENESPSAQEKRIAALFSPAQVTSKEMSAHTYGGLLCFNYHFFLPEDKKLDFQCAIMDALKHYGKQAESTVGKVNKLEDLIFLAASIRANDVLFAAIGNEEILPFEGFRDQGNAISILKGVETSEPKKVEECARKLLENPNFKEKLIFDVIDILNKSAPSKAVTDIAALVPRLTELRNKVQEEGGQKPLMFAKRIESILDKLKTIDKSNLKQLAQQPIVNEADKWFYDAVENKTRLR